MGRRRNRNNARRNGIVHQHVGQHHEHNSGVGNIMRARSAPYLKKESVTLTDTLQVFSNANLATYQQQVIGVGPNGLNIFGQSGTAKPQSALWTQYGEMYEFYQVESFSSKWYPNKFEYQRDNNNPAETGESVVAAPSYACLDPDDQKPLNPSSILAYNTSKIAPPYVPLAMRVPNYKALAIQKQEKTMLSTAGGLIGSEDTYQSPCNIVTWVQNPRRGGANGTAPLGWMVYSITYTFSGMKRPGAALPIVDPNPDKQLKVSYSKASCSRDTDEPQQQESVKIDRVALSMEEIEVMMERKRAELLAAKSNQ